MEGFTSEQRQAYDRLVNLGLFPGEAVGWKATGKEPGNNVKEWMDLKILDLRAWEPWMKGKTEKQIQEAQVAAAVKLLPENHRKDFEAVLGVSVEFTELADDEAAVTRPWNTKRIYINSKRKAGMWAYMDPIRRAGTLLHENIHRRRFEESGSVLRGVGATVGMLSLAIVDWAFGTDALLEATAMVELEGYTAEYEYYVNKGLPADSEAITDTKYFMEQNRQAIERIRSKRPK